MKMYAQFWLKSRDNSETKIFTMEDLVAIPFKVGDEIHLSIDMLSPADRLEFTDSKLEFKTLNQTYKDKLKIDNDEHRELFHHKTIKIVSVKNYARFNVVNDGFMTIEYFCEFLPE